MLRSPSLADLFNLVKERIGHELRVGLPAVVESYDAATQLADVKPQIHGVTENEDGTHTQRPLGVITNVPVVMPGAGGLRITFPVVKGDIVWLSFGDRSLDAWLSGGGDTAPVDLRTHDISDAVAFPGLHPNNSPWSGAEDGVITIGSDSGAAEFVATSQRVLTELNKLKTAFDGHTHTVPTLVCSGTATTPAPTLGAAPTASLSAPASATVKVKG